MNILLNVIIITMMVILAIGGIIAILKDFRNVGLKIGNIVCYIGVLGTFIGISQCLTDFNDLPSLLGEMQTAFQPSIIGIILNMIIKILDAYMNGFEKGVSRKEQEEVNKLLIVLFERIETHLEEQLRVDDEAQKVAKSILNNTEIIVDKIDYATEVSKQNIQVINTLNKELESSIKNVIEQNRYHLNTLVEELKTNLTSTINETNSNFEIKLNLLTEEIAKNVSEQNSDEIVDALNEIVKSFGQELNGQFGENFETLNNSVIELNKWQQDYKDIIEKNIDYLENVFNNIEVSLDGLKDNANVLIGQGKSLSAINDNIAAELEKANKVYSILKDGLKIVNNVSTETKKSVSEFNKDLKTKTHKVTGTLKSQCNTITGKLKNMADNTTTRVPDNIYTQNKEFNINRNDTLAAQNKDIKVCEVLDTVADKLQDVSTVIVDEIGNNLKKATVDISVQMQ